MTTRSIGTRVGVIISSTGQSLTVAGKGRYVGDHTPGQDVCTRAFGTSPETHRQLVEAGYTNPKIELDNGETAWGLETWWMSESEYDAIIAQHQRQGLPVIRTTMSEARQTFNPHEHNAVLTTATHNQPTIENITRQGERS